MKKGQCIGYHFVGKSLKNGRPIPANGEWLTHDGAVKMCESGLHFSRTPWQALPYAPGDTLCKVLCEDVVEEEKCDKAVCRRRKIIARINAEELMRAFARSEALRVIKLWDAPEIVVRYLKTGDESIRAAAWDAARDAARAAAWDAARDAAWDAARDAARDAAWAAARDAAWAAARDAAWDAARDAAGKRFDHLVAVAFSKQLRRVANQAAGGGQ